MQPFIDQYTDSMVVETNVMIIKMNLYNVMHHNISMG